MIVTCGTLVRNAHSHVRTLIRFAFLPTDCREKERLPAVYSGKRFKWLIRWQIQYFLFAVRFRKFVQSTHANLICAVCLIFFIAAFIPEVLVFYPRV